MEDEMFAWATLGVMAFLAFVLAAMVARYWQQKYAAVRKYADEVSAQNDELRKIIANRSRDSDDSDGEIVEVVEGRGPDDTLH